MSATLLKDLVDGRAQVVGLTVEQYHQMIELGILQDGQPIELIDGVLVRKDRSKAGDDPMTVGHGHAWAIAKLTRLAATIFKLGCEMRVQLPITIPPDGEPEPDAAIVLGSADDYRERHPGPQDIICVFEVADSSLQHDRTTKLRMYADGGIVRYVIVNLVDRTLEEYSNPRKGSGSYATSRVLRKGERLNIDLGAGQVEFTVDDLVPEPHG